MPLYPPASAGGGVSDGDKGDITVSGSGAVWSVDPGVLSDEYLPLTGGDLSGSVSWKGPSPYVDARSTALTRRAAASLTTTTGTIANGSNSLDVASATGWLVGHGVWVVRTDNTIFRSYVTVIAGTTFTCADTNTGIAISAQTTGHDDTLAIQDAIDFASVTGQVYIPPGSYYIWNIQLKTDIAVIGGGHQVTVLKSIPGNTATGMVTLSTTGQRDCQLRGMTIDGNRSAVPAPTCDGLYIFNTGQTAYRRHQFSDLRILACAGNGLRAGSQLTSQFSHIMIEDCMGHGLWFDAQCLYNQLSNVITRACGLNGVHEFGFNNSYSNLFSSSNGVVDSVTYGDGVKINNGTSGLNFYGLTLFNNLRANLTINDTDVNVPLTSNFYGTTFQTTLAPHIVVTAGIGGRINMVAAAPDAVSLATAILVMGGGTGWDIDVIYHPLSLSDLKPVIGASRLDSSNRIVVRHGNKFLQLLPGNQTIIHDRAVIPSGGRWWIDANENATSAAVLKVVQ